MLTANQVHKKDGLFPLLLAAQNGHIDCVKALLDNGAKPNQVHEETGMSPLQSARVQGHEDCVKAFLEKGDQI